MRLRVYDEIPSSPSPRPASRISQMMTQGRTMASRASSHASISMRKRSSSRPSIGRPSSFRRVNPPRRRLEPFRLLELSIYEPGNRLSDLPEFDLAEFTDSGEIQLPPRAMIRAKSEHFAMRTPNFSPPRKPAASMVEDRDWKYWQQRQSPHSSPQSDSTWSSLPGLPPYASSNPTSGPISSNSHYTPNQEPEIELTFPPLSAEPPVSPILESPTSFSSRAHALSESSRHPAHRRHRHPDALRSHSICVDSFIERPSSRPSDWIPDHSNISSAAAITSPSATYSHHTRRPTFASTITSTSTPSSPPRTSHSLSQFPVSHTRTTSLSTLSSTIFSRADSFSSATTMTTVPTLKSSRSRPPIQKSLDLSSAPAAVIEERNSLLPAAQIDGESNSTPTPAVVSPVVGVAF
ncbi:MAG: hypothetical protein Q9227_001055 [Pyrenula ochraceoflavens]